MLSILPISSVVGKVQCLREKKASDAIRIMEGSRIYLQKDSSVVQKMHYSSRFNDKNAF